MFVQKVTDHHCLTHITPATMKTTVFLTGRVRGDHGQPWVSLGGAYLVDLDSDVSRLRACYRGDENLPTEDRRVAFSLPLTDVRLARVKMNGVVEVDARIDPFDKGAFAVSPRSKKSGPFIDNADKPWFPVQPAESFATVAGQFVRIVFEAPSAAFKRVALSENLLACRTFAVLSSIAGVTVTEHHLEGRRETGPRCFGLERGDDKVTIDFTSGSNTEVAVCPVGTQANVLYFAVLDALRDANIPNPIISA